MGKMYNLATYDRELLLCPEVAVTKALLLPKGKVRITLKNIFYLKIKI